MSHIIHIGLFEFSFLFHFSVMILHCHSSFLSILLSCVFTSIVLAVQDSDYSPIRTSTQNIYLGAKFNICDWIHCENGGTCQQRQNYIMGFRCQCTFGFKGLLCEHRVNITSKKFDGYFYRYERFQFLMNFI